MGDPVWDISVFIYLDGVYIAVRMLDFLLLLFRSMFVVL